MSKRRKVKSRRTRASSTVDVSALPEAWWMALGRLHTALAETFEHPWSFDVTGWLDGKPSVHVRVHAPNGDVFMYDDAFAKAVAEHMPPGYYDDGTDVDMEVAPDGSRERGYYLYPVDREDS